MYLAMDLGFSYSVDFYMSLICMLMQKIFHVLNFVSKEYPQKFLILKIS